MKIGRDDECDAVNEIERKVLSVAPTIRVFTVYLENDARFIYLFEKRARRVVAFACELNVIRYRFRMITQYAINILVDCGGEIQRRAFIYLALILFNFIDFVYVGDLVDLFRTLIIFIVD